MEALMSSTLAYVLQHHDPEDASTGEAEALHAINPALRAIDARLPLGIEISELATVAGISVDHFTRLFKRGMGQTPSEYVRDRRILWAADYLSHVDDVLGAATRTGFANRHHFTHVFTKVMGIPPGRYRRSLNG
jgi:AraC-like DNA-binding protein